MFSFTPFHPIRDSPLDYHEGRRFQGRHKAERLAAGVVPQLSMAFAPIKSLRGDRHYPVLIPIILILIVILLLCMVIASITILVSYIISIAVVSIAVIFVPSLPNSSSP